MLKVKAAPVYDSDILEMLNVPEGWIVIAELAGFQKHWVNILQYY